MYTGQCDLRKISDNHKLQKKPAAKIISLAYQTSTITEQQG